MVVKGIIKSIDFNGNSCTVRMPYFETAGSAEVVSEALISNVPGIYNGYKENDVVWVAFDEGMMEAPVVIGKLYLGIAKEKDDPRGTINCETQSVSKTANIPFDTKLGTNLSDKQINTKAPFSSLESLASNLNRVDIEQGQNNRDLGNRLRSVVDAIGPDGEKIYSIIEQTADKISNEVVHKSIKTEPGYDEDLHKMGWNLTLGGWQIYTEGNTREIEDKTVISIQKSLTRVDDHGEYIKTLFINGTDTTLTPKEVCSKVVLEFIRKRGVNTATGEAGYDKENDTYTFEYNSTTPKLSVDEFLRSYLGSYWNKKIYNPDPEDPTKSNGLNEKDYLEQYTIADTTYYRDAVEKINVIYYETVIANDTPVEQGWNAFIDISDTGHELKYDLKYYDTAGTYYEDDKLKVAYKTVEANIKAMILFDQDGESPSQIPTGRNWYLVTYFNKEADSIPIRLVRTIIHDLTNTLLLTDRNGLYVNGLINATKGHIGQFVIGGEHTCTADGIPTNTKASGIYSDRYIKRFEDDTANKTHGVYVGTDGIKIGNNFSVDASGHVKGSNFEISLSENAQSAMGVVNKNYQSGNTTILDVYTNNDSNTNLSPFKDTDIDSESTKKVSAERDKDNQVSNKTLKYKLRADKNDQALLVLPNLKAGTPTFIGNDDSVQNWTLSFKVQKTENDIDIKDYIDKIITNEDEEIVGQNKLILFAGSKKDVSDSISRYDILPKKYNTYKMFSSCSEYTVPATDDTSLTNIKSSGTAIEVQYDEIINGTFRKTRHNEYTYDSLKTNNLINVNTNELNIPKLIWGVGYAPSGHYENIKVTINGNWTLKTFNLDFCSKFPNSDNYYDQGYEISIQLDNVTLPKNISDTLIDEMYPTSGRITNRKPIISSNSLTQYGYCTEDDVITKIYICVRSVDSWWDDPFDITKVIIGPRIEDITDSITTPDQKYTDYVKSTMFYNTTQSAIEEPNRTDVPSQTTNVVVDINTGIYHSIRIWDKDQYYDLEDYVWPDGTTRADLPYWGAITHYTTNNYYYGFETYYNAYLLKTIKTSDLKIDDSNPNYYLVKYTLNPRYYGIYNALSDLRFGLLWSNATDNQVRQLHIKEFKFEKSLAVTDYSLAITDEQNSSSNAKTIPYTDDSWTASYVNGLTGLPLSLNVSSATLRSTYQIKQSDVVTIQTTVKVASDDSRKVNATIIFVEANAIGPLGGIVQLAYTSEASTSTTTETKYKYLNNNSSTVAPPHTTDEEKNAWEDNFIEPTVDSKYAWSIPVVTVTNDTSSTSTWGDPQVVASYDGIISLLTADGINIISKQGNDYYLNADHINGTLDNKVTIGGSNGFTIKAASGANPAAIYNTIGSFNDTTQDTGVYVGTDGIRLGKNFTVDNTGHVEASSLTIQQNQVDGLPGALTNAATTGAASAVSTIEGKGYQTASDVTTITENTIQTGNLVAENLHVKAANIDGTVAATKIEVKDSSDNIVLLADADNRSAKVGGFNVSSTALYTGTKTTLTDSEAGAYFGTDGFTFTTSKSGAYMPSTTLHINGIDDSSVYAKCPILENIGLLNSRIAMYGNNGGGSNFLKYALPTCGSTGYYIHADYLSGIGGAGPRYIYEVTIGANTTLTIPYDNIGVGSFYDPLTFNIISVVTTPVFNSQNEGTSYDYYCITAKADNSARKLYVRNSEGDAHNFYMIILCEYNYRKS